MSILMKPSAVDSHHDTTPPTVVKKALRIALISDLPCVSNNI